MGILTYLFSAPAADWGRFAFFFVGIIFFIFLAEKARNAGHWSAEVNRKLVHVLTGILIFFTPFFFTSNRPLIWMAILFIVVNWIGIKTGKLKGMHDTGRKSYGTVFYPLTFLVLTITTWHQHKVVLMLSMLILALSDAAAAIVGENLKSPHEFILGKDKKSIEGSTAMLLTSIFLVFILLPIIDKIDGMSIDWATAAWIAALTGIVATALEALSSGGSDNLSAPLGAAFVLHTMLTGTPDTNVRLTLGLVMALLVAVLSFRARFLTAAGSVTTFLLAALIFGTGGWIWAAPILAFFILSSLLSKLGKKHKQQFNLMFEKSSRRDAGQVLANGGIAGAVILGFNFYPNPVWYAMYLSALAAVTADTWATEIGVFSRTNPRSITTFKTVPPGTSGGITPLGTLAAFLGALTIVLVGWLVASDATGLNPGTLIFWMIVLAGLLASLVDSMLGATIQGQYECPTCGKITEKRSHCDDRTTTLVSGHDWLNNDWVNAFCALSGALIIFLLFRLVQQ